MIFVIVLLSVLLGTLPAWAANSHQGKSEAEERQYWFGDMSGAGRLNSGSCLLPFPGTGVLTLTMPTCQGYVGGDTGELVYVTQPSVSVGPLTGGDGYYWVALHRRNNTAVAGWTRQTGTHFLWKLAASQPAHPANGFVIGWVHVTAGSVDTRADLSVRPWTDSLTLSSGDLSVSGTWTWDIPGAIITVPATKTLTFGTCPKAGRWQIFQADESATGAVRFLPYACEYVYPEWWGGSGISTGGPSASGAIQLALLSLTNSRGTVHLVNGDYPITTTVTLPNAQVTLEGEGWFTRLYGSVNPLIAYPAVARTFDGPAQNIRKLQIENTGDGTSVLMHQIWAPLVNTGPVIDTVHFKNSKVTTTTARAISLRGVNTAKIFNCYFNGINYTHLNQVGGHGIVIDALDDDISTSVMGVLIDRNYFISLGAAIYTPARTFLDPDPGRIEGIQISNNMIALVSVGIRLYRSLAAIVVNNNISDAEICTEGHGDFNPVFVGNAITGCRVAGIALRGIATYPTSGVVLVGNSITPMHSPAGIGILLENTFTDHHITDVTISGNTINGVPGTQLSAGIVLSGDNVISNVNIVGNRISSHSVGIAFLNSVTAANITMTSNSLSSNTAQVGNAAGSGTTVPKYYASSDTVTLTGGATTESFNFALPAGVFAAKPDVCFVTSAFPTGSRVIGWYDWASGSSTATNAVVILARNDDVTNVGAGSTRFNVACFGTGYAQQ